jgi:hypothetical protein
LKNLAIPEYTELVFVSLKKKGIRDRYMVGLKNKTNEKNSPVYIFLG